MSIKPISAADTRRASKHQVPGWARGVWKRLRIRLDGEVERRTRIIWIQTPLLFADIRSPAPSDSAREAEGFAGHLEIRGQIFSWQRPIDLHPPRDPGDEGAMFRDGDDMIEVGIHANYVEDWKLIGTPAEHLAMTRGAYAICSEGVTWPGDEPLEVAVVSDGHVIHAWRGPGGSGLAYHLLNRDTDTLKPRYTLGAERKETGRGGWRIWSTDMNRRQVEALGDLLD